MLQYLCQSALASLLEQFMLISLHDSFPVSLSSFLVFSGDLRLPFILYSAPAFIIFFFFLWVIIFIYLIKAFMSDTSYFFQRKGRKRVGW